MHCVLLLIYIVFAIKTWLRKNQLTSFQWLMLAILFAISTISIIDDLLFTYFYYMCSFGSLLESGIYQILIFNVESVVAWKLYCATHDLSEFAVKKNLPEEKTKKRNKCIYVTIWTTIGLMWFGYTVTVLSMGKQKNYEAVWNLGWLMASAMVLFNMIFLILFIKSHRRVSKTHKALANDPSNERKLTYVLRCITGLVVTLVIYNLLWVLVLANQNQFDTFSLVVYGIAYFVTVAFLFLLFLMITQIRTDFTLTTKVLADGRAYIVGLDEKEQEIFSFCITASDGNLKQSTGNSL